VAENALAPTITRSFSGKNRNGCWATPMTMHFNGLLACPAADIRDRRKGVVT
jgi:hypothetical protein